MKRHTVLESTATSFLVSIAGSTDINMSIENNMMRLLCQIILSKGQPMFF